MHFDYNSPANYAIIAEFLPYDTVKDAPIENAYSVPFNPDTMISVYVDEIENVETEADIFALLDDGTTARKQSSAVITRYSEELWKAQQVLHNIELHEELLDFHLKNSIDWESWGEIEKSQQTMIDLHLEKYYVYKG